jgi:hypothetical protein
MKCPKCGNNYCTITSEKKTTGKDYSIPRGIIGELLCGSLGFMFGFSNSRETKVEAYWVCKKCGHRFKG